MSQTARKNFELANQIKEISEEDLYKYDADLQNTIITTRPWKEDPHYFKRVTISGIALLKMVMHYKYKNGGNEEVMGLIKGKKYGDKCL
ncbi:cop9 signalosome complex subunit 5 [Anaeramoeba ignava]|uniref:Cop9 signalosome complex subunit 5 n=1 Tax=Anaeramoeba ignava TaxID=1746090 RepID=A0A9Q0LB62_ANAIG|nr:cop9 signalosome complex subunit 5 [Anaeramoeba ignava]